MVVDAELQVQARRKTRRIFILRILDKGLFGAHTRHQLQRGRSQRHGQRLFEVGREVVHVGNIGIGAGAVPVGCKGGGRIILSLPDVAVGAPRRADLGIAMHVAPAADPSGLEVRRIVELLGVDIARGIESRRKHFGDIIALAFGMDGRGLRGRRLVGVPACELVGIAERSIEIDARDPRFVEQPFERRIGPQGVVAHLLPLAHLRVGVVFGIHAADVGRHAEVETQDLGEGVLVIERNARARIGAVGRRGVLHGPRVLHAAVQHAAVRTQIETLRGGDLFSAGIGRKHQRIGRLALAGRNLHHARRNIAVLGRRHARHHLDRLDIRRSDVAGARARHLAQRSVGRNTHAVHLDGRAERGVSGRGTAAAQRKDVVFGQIGIYRLAARQQRRNIRSVHHLQVVDGVAADRPRGGHGIGRLLGRDDDAFQFQIVLRRIEQDTPHAGADVEFGFRGRISQTRHHETGRAFGHALHGKIAVAVGHGPQSGLRQLDDSLSDRFVGALDQHPPR